MSTNSTRAWQVRPFAFAPGTRITPPVLGLLATQGRAEVWVRESPRVSVIAIGDELVPAGEPLRPGLIRFHSRGLIL